MTTVPAKRVNGYYDVGGVLYPSITTLIDGVGSTAYRDNGESFYLDRGSLTHSAVQAFLEGIIGPREVGDWLEYEVMQNGYDIDLGDVLPGAVHGVEWCRRYVRSVRRLEVGGVNITGGYAGKPDGWGTELVCYDDGLAIVDFKRQYGKSPLRKALAQIAAQLHLEYVATANGPGEPYGSIADIKYFGNLCITPEGAYLRTYTPYQVDQAYRCCVLYLSMKHYFEQCTDGWCEQSRQYMQTFLAMAKARFEEWEQASRRSAESPDYVGWGPCWPPRPERARRPSRAADRRAEASAAAWGFTEVGP